MRCILSYLESFAGSDTAETAASALAVASAATSGAKASPAAAAAAAAAAAGEGATYMPRLFSFLSAEGHGVEAYFHGPFLVMEANGSGGCVQRAAHGTAAHRSGAILTHCVCVR